MQKVFDIPTQNLPTDFKVYVLVPGIQSDDPNIAYYYDFSQSFEEYSKAFSDLGIDWEWSEVTMSSYAETIDRHIANCKNKTPVFFNLCDGDEINGAPGLSVIHYLEQKRVVYTGADSSFYEITTSKIPMKLAFDNCNIPTPAWGIADLQKANSQFSNLGSPLIIKPAVSGGSMGVGIDNVVYTSHQYANIVHKIESGYRGWDLNIDGAIVEKYVKGEEYTTMLVGSWDDPEKIVYFDAVHRKFHSSLKDDQKFLSFDRLWEIYENEPSMPNSEFFFEYNPVDQKLNEQLKEISIKAYKALKGKSYTRIDIRQDQETKQLYVLEANAQCGLSEDENYTSIGAILRVSKKTFAELILMIIFDAIKGHL
ncbi:MAG: hypothetical protein K1X49_04035 [Saprospiraceae bacterium]|nr:hypothetical protein [Saprospiraceae bacterium]